MRQWFKMQAAEGVGEIVIYDEIGASFWGEDSVSAKQFLATLEGLGDVNSITLRINSPGGDVFDGLAIHNALKNHKATVTAHIDGIAASIASYIAMAADSIVMPANTFMLVHRAQGLVMEVAFGAVFPIQFQSLVCHCRDSEKTADEERREQQEQPRSQAAVHQVVLEIVDLNVPAGIVFWVGLRQRPAGQH
jgi:ATP-dependent protease ClpP protease subunit